MHFIFLFITLLNFTTCEIHAEIPNPSSIKAVIFDCDGTLIDTEQAQYVAWAYAFRKQGYELNKKEYSFLINKNSLSGLPSANKIIAELGAEIIGLDCSIELLNDMNMYCEELRAKGFPPKLYNMTYRVHI
jgi:phosphoglycolate phosphatase-like HAD superfamily hydrolase